MLLKTLLKNVSTFASQNQMLTENKKIVFEKFKILRWALKGENIKIPKTIQQISLLTLTHLKSFIRICLNRSNGPTVITSQTDKLSVKLKIILHIISFGFGQLFYNFSHH